MSTYSLVLFIHILGAFGLFTTTGINLLVLARLRRTRTVAQARDLLEITHAAARFDPVIALALLGPGLYLTTTVGAGRPPGSTCRWARCWPWWCSAASSTPHVSPPGRALPPMCQTGWSRPRWLPTSTTRCCGR